MELAEFVSNIEFGDSDVVLFHPKNGGCRCSQMERPSVRWRFPNHQSIAHGKTCALGRNEASYRCSVVAHTLLLRAVGIPDFAWVETESESELIHVVVLVFFLPRPVAGFAYTNSTFRRDKVTRAPHFCCIIKGKDRPPSFLSANRSQDLTRKGLPRT